MIGDNLSTFDAEMKSKSRKKLLDDVIEVFATFAESTWNNDQKAKVLKSCILPLLQDNDDGERKNFTVKLINLFRSGHWILFLLAAKLQGHTEFNFLGLRLKTLHFSDLSPNHHRSEVASNCWLEILGNLRTPSTFFVPVILPSPVLPGQC